MQAKSKPAGTNTSSLSRLSSFKRQNSVLAERDRLDCGEEASREKKNDGTFNVDHYICANFDPNSSSPCVCNRDDWLQEPAETPFISLVATSDTAKTRRRQEAGRSSSFLPLLPAGKRDYGGGLEEECRRCLARKEKVLEYVEKAEKYRTRRCFSFTVAGFQCPIRTPKPQETT